MYSKRSHNIKHKLKKKDRYYTPIGLAKELIDLVPFKPNDIVLDCCFGKGAFYNNYPEFVEKEWCEIDMGVDFFEYNKKVHWIVSNPPYSLLDEWLKKTYQLCRKGFGYLIGINNLTAKRIEEANAHNLGLTKFHLFKVFKWFGMSCFVVFEKNKNNIITYNRVVWKEQNNNLPKIKDKEKYKSMDDFIQKKK